MLPLGPEVSTLLASLDICRRNIYTVIDRINQLDKENSERAFSEFKQNLKVVNEQASVIARNAKQFSREYAEGEQDASKMLKERGED